MEPIVNKESIGFRPILRVGDTRILRPYEAKILINSIPKETHRDQFEALLYTGMRYIEVQRLQANPDWFDGEHIHLPKGGVKKGKIIYKERYIHLNPIGRRVVRAFLHNSKPLPNYNVFQENLKRWMDTTDLPNYKLNCKTTRKTWEGWLVSYHTNKMNQIFLSQGHSQMTALRYYLNLPFDSKDKLDMREFVEGWE